MASSMISGDRRRAMRRGGMTVLGKVAVPKPINLPSQRSENHGLDLNVEIVPKGTLGWGSRPSSAGSNAWGTSVLSPRTDGSSVSPSHLSGRPSSGGGSRPSTAGSEKGHDSANAWGSNSRPSSASGALTSNHISLRPRSAETRPGSSQLSRFAEPLTESSVPWGATGTAEKLGAESSANDGFSLSSGDFPTLGSEKDNSGKNTESQDCGSNSRPRSSSARLSSVAERTTISPGDDVSRHPDGKSGLANSWGRDNHYENGPWSGMERWHGDPHPFPNPNLRPHHYESWNGAPGVNPPVGVWYRGPPATPYGAPVAPGGFSMEPFPYYCPPVSAPGLANSQPGQHPGAGPHGHRPKSGDMYGPRIPDSFIRPAMHIRPGFYPGPVPYEGYYGPPPMGFCNPNEQDFPYMGMAAVGPHAYNRYPNHNAADINNSQAKSCEGTTPEKLESGPVDDSRGHSKVLVKENHSWDRDDGEGKWGNKVRSNSSNHDKGDFLKSSAEEDAWGYDHKEEEMSYRKIAHRNDSSSPSFEDKVGCINPGNVKFADMNPVIENVAPPRDHTLIQKIEGLNAKARASDARHGLASSFCADEPHNRVQVVEAKPSRPTDEAVVGMVHLERHHPSGVLVPVSCDTGILMGDKSIEAAVAIRTTVPRRATQGVQIQGDHHLRGKFNNPEADGWRKKNAASEFPSASLETTTEVQVQVCPVVPPSNETSKSYIEGKDDVALPAFDHSDSQRAKMREIAKQRAIQRQEEEEERTREQKAKALAKLEELDRRSSANQSKEGSIQNSENVASHGSGLHKQEEDEERSGLSFDTELSRAALTPSCNAERETGERSASKVLESAVTVLQQNQPLLTSQEGISTQHKKRMGYKQSVPFEKSPAEKSISATLGDSLSKEGSGTIVSACDSNLPVESLAISEPSVHHRRKNSRSVKNKHKLEESSSAVQLPSVQPQKESDLESVTENVMPDSSKLDPKSVQSLDDSKDAIPSSDNHSSLPCENTHGRVTNSWKQHPRKNPRNAPVNRSSEMSHGNNAVVWTPVRSLSKVEVIDDTNLKAAESAAAPAKSDHLVHNTSRSRRAEMERYVPKPVAKELAQQASVQQSSSPSVDQMTNVESKNTDSKPRGVTNASMNMQTSPELLQTPKANEELLAGQEPKPDEWNDGWNTFDENVTAPRAAYLGVKYQGFSGRGKQNSFRGNRGSGICHHTLDPKNSKDSQSLHVDTIQTERTASSKENRVVGHWQPKSQVYVNDNRDVDPPSKHKEDTSADITEPLPVQCTSGKTDLYGRQNEGRRETRGERKATPLEGHDSRGDRSSNVQDDKQQHYGNRDRRRQNPQYEYQHVGPYNTSKSNNSESQTDNLNMGGPRFRERRHSHSRGNGGSFYGRGKGEILK